MKRGGLNCFFFLKKSVKEGATFFVLYCIESQKWKEDESGSYYGYFLFRDVAKFMVNGWEGR